MINFIDLYNAYKTCAQNKSFSKQQATFEMRLGQNLVQLARELSTRTYSPSPHHCFIATRPKPREIFAAHFKDRVVHHYLIGKLTPIWEKKFSSSSFACRKGKGTLSAIKELKHKVHKISKGGTQPVYVLQMDIKTFFPSIHRNTLVKLLQTQSFSKWGHADFQDKYRKYDVPFLNWLIQISIGNDARKKCTRYRFTDTENLIQKEKSWFSKSEEFGIPIGNLTSQFSANVYLNDLDHFIVHNLKPKFNLRYVDDLTFVDTDQNKLEQMIAPIKEWLWTHRKMEINDAKTKLTRLRDGITFLGYKVFQTLPSHNEGQSTRILLAKKKKWQFINAIRHTEKLDFSVLDANHPLDKEPSFRKTIRPLAKINSRLGHMKHAKSFEFKKRTLRKMLKNKLKIKIKNDGRPIMLAFNTTKNQKRYPGLDFSHQKSF